jgi:hypothetical protein
VRYGCGWPDSWPWGRCGVDVAKSPYYVCAHSGKEYQKFGNYPKGARMYGMYFNQLIFGLGAKVSFNHSGVPKWLQAEIEFRDDLWQEKIKRCKGGGYLVGREFFKSPYQVIYKSSVI